LEVAELAAPLRQRRIQRPQWRDQSGFRLFIFARYLLLAMN
jgi:hypothetical protein